MLRNMCVWLRVLQNYFDRPKWMSHLEKSVFVAWKNICKIIATEIFQSSTSINMCLYWRRVVKTILWQSSFDSRLEKYECEWRGNRQTQSPTCFNVLPWFCYTGHLLLKSNTIVQITATSWHVASGNNHFFLRNVSTPTVNFFLITPMKL